MTTAERLAAVTDTAAAEIAAMQQYLAAEKARPKRRRSEGRT